MSIPVAVGGLSEIDGGTGDARGLQGLHSPALRDTAERRRAQASTLTSSCDKQSAMLERTSPSEVRWSHWTNELPSRAAYGSAGVRSRCFVLTAGTASQSSSFASRPALREAGSCVCFPIRVSSRARNSPAAGRARRARLRCASWRGPRSLC